VRNEIKCLQELTQHSNIIGFVHAKEFANYIILAIEYAPGGTLQDLIKASKKN
jgi:serine/threonine protein kinase